MASKGETTTQTVWVCTDCIMVLANGDDSGRAEGSPEPLALLEGEELTPGMGWEEHADDCPARLAGRPDEGCDCETVEFSSASCDGCGSPLAGRRHAVTVHGVHVGHWSRFGGAYWCDTCDSPYCDRA